MPDKITFNADKKFDIQLSQALIDERRLAWMFENATFDGVKIEAKDERWQWQQTGNICVEWRNHEKPSGIACTEADYWVHTLHDEKGMVLVHLVFPVDVLLWRARRAYKEGKYRTGGDQKQSKFVLIPVADIITGRAWNDGREDVRPEAGE